jgi:hypothetical protein
MSADTNGAVTWLDPKTGLDLSAAAGFAFNGENSATNYWCPRLPETLGAAKKSGANQGDRSLSIGVILIPVGNQIRIF